MQAPDCSRCTNNFAIAGWLHRDGRGVCGWCVRRLNASAPGTCLPTDDPAEVVRWLDASADAREHRASRIEARWRPSQRAARAARRAREEAARARMDAGTWRTRFGISP